MHYFASHRWCIELFQIDDGSCEDSFKGIHRVDEQWWGWESGQGVADSSIKRAKDEKKDQISGNWFGDGFGWTLRFAIGFYQWVSEYDGWEVDECERL